MATPITMAAATVAPSQPLRFHSEISLDNSKFYTGPSRKWTASPQHYTVTASEKGASSTPQIKHKIPLSPPRNNPRAYQAWLIRDPNHDYENDYHKNFEDDEEDVYGDASSQVAGGSSQVDPTVIKDSTADPNLEAEGDGADNNTGNKAGKADDQLTPYELGDGNDRSDDDEGEKSPSLEEFEDLFGASVYNHIKLTAEDINEINGLVERTDVVTIPQASPLTGKESDYEKGNVGGESLLTPKKRKLEQLERSGVIDYDSNNSAKDSSGRDEGGEGGGPRPQKQQKPPASRENLAPRPPIGLDSQCPQVDHNDHQAISTTRPTNPSLQGPTSLHNVELLRDETSNLSEHNHGGDDDQGGVSNSEPAAKHRTPQHRTPQHRAQRHRHRLQSILRRSRAKDNEANKTTVDDEWEICKILEERITESGLEYKVAWMPTWVHESGLSNAKHALKSYKKRVQHAKVE